MSAFSGITLPSTDEEVWRYSRIADLDLDAYHPASTDGAAAGRGPGSDRGRARHGARAGRDGRRRQRAHRRTSRSTCLASTSPAGDDRTLVGSVMSEPTDVFAGMNGDFGGDVVTVRIAPGANVEAPIVVAHWSDETDVATFPRLVVAVGEDSHARVIDYHASAARRADAHACRSPSSRSSGAARLGYLNAQNLGLATWQIGSQVSTVDADATFTSTAAAFGGDYARQRTDCRLVGRGATGRLRAVYFGEDEQMLDFRTFQDHAAPDTTSNLLFKGAVGGHSRSVYTGLIRVRKNARGTNAFQTNRNIKLSDGAWAESVPNLEIENNDVRCSHASAVGPIDEDQRFYLESRGVPTPIAERLVVTGFFDEVLSQAAGARRPPRHCAPSSPASSTAKSRLCTVAEHESTTSSARSTSWRPGPPGASTSTVIASRSSAATTTSTPSATVARTPTSRCPKARSCATSARSSAGSTAARSRS